MIIFPAIDLAKGRCVRLIQGRRDDETVYSQSPADVARNWESQGARYLHIVDLDAAFEGATQNQEAIRSIVEAVRIPVQLGGGLRTIEAIRSALALGPARVILGTAAVRNPELVVNAIEEFGPEHIVIGIDVRNGLVAVQGWTTLTQCLPVDLGLRMKEKGVRTFAFTDISRDGMLQGPNLESLRFFAKAVGGGVIASGGISSIDDVRNVAQLSENGVAGMIVGKALYEERFSLRQALEITEGKAE